MNPLHELARKMLREATRKLEIVTVTLSEIAPAGNNGTVLEDTQKISHTDALNIAKDARKGLENFHSRLSLYIAGM